MVEKISPLEIEVVDERDKRTKLKGEAKKFYQKNFDLLKSTGSFTKVDVELLEILSSVYADYIFYSNLFEDLKLKEDVSINDLTKLTSLKNVCLKSYLLYSNKLGLNAYDRGKIRVPKQNKKTDASFLSSLMDEE